MEDKKLKKKPSFFKLKRWNSQKSVTEPTIPKLPLTPQANNNQFFKSQFPPVGSRAINSAIVEQKPKNLPAGGIKELVQCSLCLGVLHNPKMLPCQHTFCMACLSVYISDSPSFECPICRNEIVITDAKFVENLPSNLYIDSLLQLVGINNDTTAKSISAPSNYPTIGTAPQSIELYAGGVRCSQCQTMCDNADASTCQHCKLSFCRLCWNQHLDDMRNQIQSILKQLNSAANHLEHKIEYYKDRCEHITDQINLTADEKVESILETKEKLLFELADLQKIGDLSALALKSSLDEAIMVASKVMTLKEPIADNEKISTYMNLHHNAVQILSDVTKWDSERFIFDKENFTLEIDAATPTEAESDEPLPTANKQDDPLESEDNLIMHYRTRNFVPHYVWRKTARPSGVGISPWNNYLYICGTDSRNVLALERSQAKIVTRLSCDEMLYPVHIAFLKKLGEIYVTDKWKHCIHVFSKDGDYLRSVGQKGSRLGMFRSPEGIATDNERQLIYVVDTGNDRVQILEPDGKFVDQIGVGTKLQTNKSSSLWNAKEITCTELNAPTSVAVTKDRVIVLDSGNRRVKVYNKQDKNKILEFGSLGQRKGQFRQPEVLAVDPMGYILVGDSGNCRVQVFKSTGQLVRVFGGYGTEPGKFGWISGIYVSKELDIIISDTKNHSVSFF